MPSRTTLYSKAARLQREIAERVVTRDDFARLDSICAVDVAYDDTTAYCAAVVNSRAGKLLEVAESASSIEYPYVPGFLMMRESPPAIRTLGMLKCNYDVLIVDGHGQLHPRRCGIACYLGVTLDIPAIGVAKSLLCGTVRTDGSVELDGRVTGREIVIGKKAVRQCGPPDKPGDRDLAGKGGRCGKRSAARCRCTVKETKKGKKG